MSGRVKWQIDNKAERARLEPRGAPYFGCEISSTTQLGFRKGKTRSVWVLRHRLEDGSYVNGETIGRADDGLADTLDFNQARDKALAIVMGETPLAKGASPRSKAKGEPCTVADAMNAYFKTLEQEGRSTWRIRSFNNSSILPTLGNKRLCDLDNDLLRSWLADLANSPRKIRGGRTLPAPKTAEQIRRRRASANRVWATLRAALNKAVENKHIPSNAGWSGVKPLGNAKAARVRWLQRDEIKRLVNACDEPFRSLVQAALFSGCRYGELCQLLAGDFDPRAETLLVRTSKSGKPRQIILTREAATFFARLAANRRGDELLLTRGDGAPWGPNQQGKRMADACRSAGIEPTNFHALRHSFASLMLQDDVPMLVVAHSLGHSDTRMVEEHYGHLAASHVRETIRNRMQPLGIVESDGSNIVTLRR